jgi:hypothetical protein
MEKLRRTWTLKSLHPETRMNTAHTAPPPVTLLHMMTGCWVSQAIHVAAKLGIADLLRDGPRSPSALAESTRTHAGALRRVLRALASLGVFAEDEDGRFRSTPLAEPLQAGAPSSLRAYAIMLGEREHWRAWEGFLQSVGTGECAFEHVFGEPHFKYFAAHPEAGRIFDEAMTSRSAQENKAILAAYDFAGARKVVDVGGGQGTLLSAILRARPTTHGVLFDLPHVLAASRPRIESAGQTARCELVAGNFFASVPTGGDIYLLKKVIHDWEDERARAILRSCRNAMHRTARLLLIEPVIPPGNDPSFNKLLDLLMLVWTSGGQERTEAEHQANLVAAGLRVSRVIPTNSGVSIIEAVRA